LVIERSSDSRSLRGKPAPDTFLPPDITLLDVSGRCFFMANLPRGQEI
jgi:hypothetical protein